MSASDSNQPPAKPDDDREHQKLDARLMLRLWAYLLPYKRASLFCLAASLGVAGLRLLQPIVIHRLIETEVAAGDIAGVTRMSLIFLCLVILTFILDVTFNYLTGVVGQKAMHDLRMNIFRHVNKLDVSFFDRNPVGRLVTRMTSDVTTLNDLFASGVIEIFAQLLMIVGIIGVMFAYNVKLTFVALGSLPFMFVIIALFRQESRKW